MSELSIMPYNLYRMNKLIKIVGGVVLSLVLVSCTQEKKVVEKLPAVGEVEYEVSYSKDIFDDFLVGQFLPRRIMGVYNKEGIKMNVSSGFGMMNANVVLTPADSYVELKLSDRHILMPLKEAIIQDSIIAHNGRIVVEHRDTLVNVMGYDSKSMMVRIDAEGLEHIPFSAGMIEVFYVPMDGVDFSIANLPQFTVPGLITAMKLHNGEGSSVMLMLSKVKEKQTNDVSFERPRDAIEIHLEDLIDMKNIYLKAS